MRSSKTIFLVFTLFLMLSACKTEERAAAERRNLMMPQRQELRKNDKYVPSKQKKTYSTSKQKKKKQKSKSGR